MFPRILAAGAALTLIAGCGGGDDDASDATTSTSTAPAPEPDDTAADDTSDDSAASASEWCGLAVEFDDLGELADAMLAGDQAALENYFASAVPLMESAPSIAPDEIADDVAISAEVFLDLGELLAANDYDMLSADLSSLDERMTENLAASEAIEQYNAEHCGIAADDDVDDATTDSDFSLGEGSIRDQFIDQLVAVGFTSDEAECVFDNVDFSAAESFEDPAAMMEVFGTCDIDLERLAQLDAGGLGGAEPAPDADRATVDDAAAEMLANLGLNDEQVNCVIEAIADPAALSDGSGIFDAATACDIDLTDLSGANE